MSNYYGIFLTQETKRKKAVLKEFKELGFTEKVLKGFKSEAEANKFIQTKMPEFKDILEVCEYMYI